MSNHKWKMGHIEQQSILWKLLELSWLYWFQTNVVGSFGDLVNAEVWILYCITFSYFQHLKTEKRNHIGQVFSQFLQIWKNKNRYYPGLILCNIRYSKVKLRQIPNCQICMYNAKDIRNQILLSYLQAKKYLSIVWC